VISGQEKKGRFHFSVPQLGNYALARDLTFLIAKAKRGTESSLPSPRQLWIEPEPVQL